MRIRGICLALSLIVPLAGAALAAPPTESFDAFVDRASTDWVRRNPMTATSERYFSGAEQDALDRHLVAFDNGGLPLDAKARASALAFLDGVLAQLKQYPKAELTPVQRVSAATLEWYIGNLKRADKIANTQFIFDQFQGLQIGLVNFLTQIHPIDKARDIENYIVRLKQVPGVIDQGIAAAELQDRKGVRPPRFILTATMEGIDRFMDGGPEKNVLVTTLRERAAKIAGQEARFTEAQDIIRTGILPAFQRLKDMLTRQMAHANDDAGMWRLPGGPAAYQQALIMNTTTTMTPTQIHELGLKRVAEIEAEMDKIFKRIGQSDGSIQSRFDALEVKLQPTGPNPQDFILARANEILRDAQRRSKADFNLTPKAAVEISREPAFTEKGAAAHYMQPAPDGSRPGMIWLPLPGPTFEMATLRTLIYHEGVPGHHFQIALQRESTSIPRFRQLGLFGSSTAFVEGWALYAEYLAAEQGWYEGDDQGHIGQLYDELFRARRLVVDTGLHAMHWTRQQAIDYGIEPSEVDRYVVMPGQACAYMIGQLDILKQREKMRQAQGAKFSLKAFHDLLLTTGELPLEIFNKVIDDHIAGR